jgi:hypothetical protein
MAALYSRIFISLGPSEYCTNVFVTFEMTEELRGGGGVQKDEKISRVEFVWFSFDKEREKEGKRERGKERSASPRSNSLL